MISEEAVNAAADVITQGDVSACECRRSIFDKHDVNPPCSTRRRAEMTALRALQAATQAIKDCEDRDSEALARAALEGAAAHMDVPFAAVDAAYDAALGTAVTTGDIERILAAAANHLRGGAIATAEELDALPVGSVVLSHAYTHHENGMPIAFQRWTDGAWHRGARSSDTHPDNIIPATVLHRPAL